MCTVSYQPGSHTVRNTKLRQHLDNKRLNTVKSQLIRTSSKMTFNSIFMSEIFTTWTTAKLFVAQVYQLMSFQFMCCIETLWTFTANIRLHTFMSTQMCLKATTVGELLMTNTTYQPSTFIVWLQQMCLELATPCKTFWTLSTWVRLCTSVNMNMALQFSVCLKQLPTVRTVIWSSVAVYTTFMWLQVAGLAETFVTQWTFVRVVSCVESHVCGKSSRLTKCLVTHVTFVFLVSCVDCHVCG